MKYYEFITQFAGIEHPFGDLGEDIRKDVESGTDPDRLLNLFEGDDFSDIYNHLVERGACQECVNTFIQSWAAWLDHEKKAMKDPLPALVLDRLSCLPDIAENIDIISDVAAEFSQFLYDVKKGKGILH